MWAPLGYKHYILKKEKLEDGYCLYASDFINLWVKRLKNEEIAAISKEMNPLIEAPELKLVEKVLSLLGGNAVTCCTLDEKEICLNLYLESDISGIKFQFKVGLELQNAEMFFKEITLPFMLLAARLQIREKKLIEIILKKDAEINEYRRENEQIKRSHLITKEFDRSDFMEGEIEESNSLDAVMNNPSTILNIVDLAMFESAKSHKLKQDNDNNEMSNQNDEVTNPINILSVKEIATKKNKKSVTKTVRNKSKIDLYFNAGTKKKRDRFNLKF